MVHEMKSEVKNTLSSRTTEWLLIHVSEEAENKCRHRLEENKYQSKNVTYKYQHMCEEQTQFNSLLNVL
jgi:hypothetical protein